MPRITDIDRLYGLEPVFEPSDATGGEGPESFADVCCQPMQVDLQVNDEGSLDSVTAERMDH